jgi:phenylacetate-CoA ligase
VPHRLSEAVQRAAAHAPDRALGAISAVDRLAHPAFRRIIREWRTFLHESEQWTTEVLAAYQLERLRVLLEHAQANVPYYRELFRAHGVKPEDVRQLSDLRRLPVLEKADLQRFLPELVSTDVPPEDRRYFTTAGSTGIPVGFYHAPEQAAVEWAFMTTQWQRVGYEDGDSSIVLRGSVVSNGKLFERAAIRNELVMSSYRLTDELMPIYLERIRAFRPRFIQAYPSSVTLLARHMVERGERPPEGLKAVLCGSENLYPWQRELIEAAFRCRVFSWYGQSENVCLAGECEYDTRLHVFPQYGITELVDKRGAPVAEPGARGEIIATGLIGRGTPLIRYRTMDVAVLGDRCELCRRPYALLERIEGRLQEFLITTTGRPISMAAINMHSPVFDNVQQFRFYQDTPGKAVLKIVPKPSFSWEQDEPSILAELALKVGEGLQLGLELVPEIPRTRTGKFRFLDQRLENPLGVEE